MDVRRWLIPTLLGPCATTLGYITCYELFVPPPPAPRIVTFMFRITLGLAISFLLFVLLVGWDFVLLWSKRRRLPVGGRAWAGALLAPVVVYALCLLGESWVGLWVCLPAVPLGVLAARLVVPSSPRS